MISSVNDDPWTLSGHLGIPSSIEMPLLQVHDLGDIMPLDAQIGIEPKLTVPPRLRPALFGPQDIGPDLATYAILDAARIFNLPEMLAQGTDAHECLFKGGARDDWGHVAPWLVALDEGSAFTRRLFTRGPAAWHLWDDQAGIFLRSALDLHSLWRHFRKFTRTVDRQGRWHYLRFYDPVYLIDYVSSLAPEKLAKFTSGVDSMIVARPGRSVVLKIVRNAQSSSSATISGNGK